MRCYFDTEGRIGCNTVRAMATVEDSDAVYEEMKVLRTAVLCAVRYRFYDSEIFYHESCMYLEVLAKLLDEGYFV